MKTICTLKIVLIIIGFYVLTSYSGQWEIFTGKNDVRDIALSGNTLWAATTGGVVAWDLDDNSYKSYNTLDGLLSCNITQVAIDKKGRPWVATKGPNSLFVYENDTWKQMKIDSANNDNELADKTISDLEVDRFGNVWVCTRSEEKEWYIINDKYLWRYDGRVWHKHEGVYGPLALDLQNNLLAVDSILETDALSQFRIRIVSFDGVEFNSKWNSKVVGKTGFIALAHIALDSKDNPWISYYDDRINETFGVVCNDILYNTLDGLGDDNVRSITPDKSGSVWCATDGGISKFTGDSWVTYDTTRGVASNLTYKILIDSNNTLYAATSKGISILKSNQWKTLKTINDQSHNNYTDMAIDKSDAVIFAGDDHITIYDGFQWKMNYYRHIRLGNSYHGNYNNKSFIKSKDGTGNLYAIGKEIGKGWILKQEKEGSTFVKAFSCTLEKPYQIMSPALACSNNGSCFWLTGSHGNLILMNKQTTTIYPPSRFDVGGEYPSITCMLLDRDGRSVWVGYSSYQYYIAGIVHFDGDTVKKRIYESNGYTAIARDSSGNLWFSSRRGSFQSGSVSVLRDKKITAYIKDSDGKEFGSCNALFVDKSGTVWTHSDNGIARFDGSSWKLFDSAVVSPDLPYANYSHIVHDKSGTVWFGTEGSGLLAYKDNRWYQFTAHDSIPSNNIRGCAVDSKNNLWILTDHGIAMRKSDETFHSQARHDFLNPGNKWEIKRRGSRFYFSSKDKYELIEYTLFDLRGRVVLRQTIHNRKFILLPESNYHFGSGLRILSITTNDTDGSQNKYLFKIGDVK